MMLKFIVKFFVPFCGSILMDSVASFFVFEACLGAVMLSSGQLTDGLPLSASCCHFLFHVGGSTLGVFLLVEVEV